MATQQDYITRADLEEALKPIRDKIDANHEAAMGKIDANHEAVMQSITSIARAVGANPDF